MKPVEHCANQRCKADSTDMLILNWYFDSIEIRLCMSCCDALDMELFHDAT